MFNSRILLVSLLAMILFTACSSGTAVTTDVDRDSLNQRTEDSLGVAVSPHTLLLSRNQGGSVVVHTYIPYSTVDTSTVTLNDVPAEWTKADDCGNLVAYFDEWTIKDLVSAPEFTLYLRGYTKDGTFFEGSDTVRVVE